MNPSMGKAHSPKSQSNLCAVKQHAKMTNQIKAPSDVTAPSFQMNKKLLLPVPPLQENKPQLHSVSTSQQRLCFHTVLGEGSTHQFMPWWRTPTPRAKEIPALPIRPCVLSQGQRAKSIPASEKNASFYPY